jgi:hypothetical protein
MTDKADGATPRMSSQMEAVMRLMTGKEERTIAEKMADSNRPTWEQYKKDNQDKLNLSGADQQKMEEYRKELDEQRDRMLARGRGDKSGDKKKKHKKKRSKYDSDSDTSDSEEEERRRKKHKKSKKRRKKHKRRDDDSDSESDSSSEEERRRKKKKRKKSKKKDDDDDDDRYKLSSFFTKGASSDE